MTTTTTMATTENKGLVAQATTEIAQAFKRAISNNRKPLKGFDYEPFAIRVNSNLFCAPITQYYVATQEMTQMILKASHNITRLMKSVELYAKNGVQCIPQQNAMARTQAMLSVYNRQKREILNKVFTEFLGRDHDSLYSAYTNKMVDEFTWRNELALWYLEHGVEMNDQLYAYIDRQIGARSGSTMARANDFHVVAMGKRQFYTLFMDLNLMLCLEKGTVKKAIIEKTFGETLVLLNEFVGYIQVARCDETSTCAQLRYSLDQMGIEYPKGGKGASQENLYKLYKMGVKNTENIVLYNSID